MVFAYKFKMGKMTSTMMLFIYQNHKYINFKHQKEIDYPLAPILLQRCNTATPHAYSSKTPCHYYTRCKINSIAPGNIE